MCTCIHIHIWTIKPHWPDLVPNCINHNILQQIPSICQHVGGPPPKEKQCKWCKHGCRSNQQTLLHMASGSLDQESNKLHWEIKRLKHCFLSLLVFTNQVPLLLGCLCLTLSSKTSKVYLNDHISRPQLETNFQLQVLWLYSTPYSLVSITFHVIIIWKLLLAATD